MATRGKKYKNAVKAKSHDAVSILEGIKHVKKSTYSSFTGSAELHLVINLPKDKDAKSVKGSVTLPHGEKKEVKIAVFSTPENVKLALTAGATKAGLEDLMKEVQSGKIDFDVAIATPDVMPKIAVLGKVLGPKGIMPNPKTGTVTTDVEKTIKAYLGGKMDFKADAQGGIHLSAGKLSLDDDKLIENINALLKSVEEAYGKGLITLVKDAYLAPTMGKSIRVRVE